MMLDVTVINSKLSTIAEAGKNLSSLQTLVKDKPVPRKNVGQTMAGLLKRNGAKKGDGAESGDGEVSADGEAAKGDDGDEEDEGLGILPAETADQPASTADSKEPAAESAEPAPAAKGNPPTPTPAGESKLPAPRPPEKDDAQTPSTPSRDAGKFRPSLESRLTDLAQEDAITEEVLAAPPTDAQDLPVAPIQPVDEPVVPANEDHAEGDATAPPPPDKDEDRSSQNEPEPETVAESKAVLGTEGTKEA